ncbi:MAG TPA: hypothetical protein VJ785_09635 [Anaerolineales bacterium]|nr:hypothetical protein [Anaerolineales bacterium]
MITLRNKETSTTIGTISEEELSYLIDMLEEEDSQDRDYWIDQTTLDYFEDNGCDDHLLEMLKDAIGDREGIEILWSAG